MFSDQDELYYRDKLPFLTGIAATEHFSGIVVVTQSGHDSMPVTLYSRVAWRCDDALFKIANPNLWFGYLNCMNEKDEEAVFKKINETFESLGLNPALELRLKDDK